VRPGALVQTSNWHLFEALFDIQLNDLQKGVTVVFARLQFYQFTGKKVEKKIAAELILRSHPTSSPKRWPSPYGHHRLTRLESSRGQGLVQLCPRVLHEEFDKHPAHK
jgi:hypothetical protein